MKEQPPGQYVVIGASGILAPLGQMLKTMARHTVGVSRGSRLDQGEWDERAAIDTRDLQVVRSWIASRDECLGTVVAYAPAVSDPVWQLLDAQSDRLVIVATSAWAQRSSSQAPWRGLDARVIQLGWVTTHAGVRWHTSQEVSSGVIHELVKDWTAGICVLGSLEPWESKPH